MRKIVETDEISFLKAFANKKRIDPRYFLHENITYTIRKDEDDGGPTVEVQGVDITFVKMVEDLNDTVIDFDDGDAPEVFQYSDVSADGPEEAAEFMIQNGIAKYYVEAWAKMNDMQAIQKGARD